MTILVFNYKTDALKELIGESLGLDYEQFKLATKTDTELIKRHPQGVSLIVLKNDARTCTVIVVAAHLNACSACLSRCVTQCRKEKVVYTIFGNGI